jgi:hypothetical protein
METPKKSDKDADTTSKGGNGSATQDQAKYAILNMTKIVPGQPKLKEGSTL